MPWGERSFGEPALRLGNVFVSSGSRTNHPLNSAFVRGVSGAAIGIRYRCLTNEPINEIYVFNDLTTGTRANVSLVARIWDAAASGTQPGSTLRATSNAASLPATDDRWVRLVFPTPYTPAAGEYVFITVDNTAAAPATDFCGLMNASAGDFGNRSAVTAAFTTTNGFSTAGASQPEMPHVILQGSSTVYGNPFGLQVSISSFVGKRGILLSQDVKRFQARWWRIGGSNSNLTNVQIYDLATPPSGSPLLDFAVPAGLDRLLGIARVDWDLSTLPGAGPFVLCAVFSSSSAYTNLGAIEDYTSFPSVFDLFSADNFAYCPVVTESAGAWVVDRSRIGGSYLEAIDTAGFSAGGLMLPIGFDGGLG